MEAMRFEAQEGESVGYELTSEFEYRGEWRAGYFHGRGRYIKGNEIYTGEFKQGKKEGYGSLVRGSLEAEGKFKFDILTGWGVCKQKGVSFKGSFTEGNIVGFGQVEDSTNNTLYRGFFEGGLFSNLGFQTGEGWTYFGEFYKGEQEGFGVRKLPKAGYSYLGGTQKGMKEGFAVEKVKEDQYQGDFSKGQKEGRGKMESSDGSIYTGIYLQGKKNGQGKLEIPGKYFYVGSWKENKKNGIGFEKSSETDNYFGMWSDDIKSGYGIETKKGKKYNGNFLKGIYNGHGILSIIGERDKVGIFQNGELVESLGLSGISLPKLDLSNPAGFLTEQTGIFFQINSYIEDSKTALTKMYQKYQQTWQEKWTNVSELIEKSVGECSKIREECEEIVQRTFDLEKRPTNPPKSQIEQNIFESKIVEVDEASFDDSKHEMSDDSSDLGGNLRKFSIAGNTLGQFNFQVQEEPVKEKEVISEAGEKLEKHDTGRIVEGSGRDLKRNSKEGSVDRSDTGFKRVLTKSTIQRASVNKLARKNKGFSYSRSKSVRKKRIGHEYSTDNLLREENEKNRVKKIEDSLQMAKDNIKKLEHKLKETEKFKQEKNEIEKELEEEKKKVKTLKIEMQDLKERIKKGEDNHKEVSENLRVNPRENHDYEMNRRKTMLMEDHLAKSERLKEKEVEFEIEKKKTKELQTKIIELEKRLEYEERIRKEAEDKLSISKGMISDIKSQKEEKESMALEYKARLEEMEKKEREWEELQQALNSSIKQMKASEEELRFELEARRQEESLKQQQRNSALSKEYFEAHEKPIPIAKNGMNSIIK